MEEIYVIGKSFLIIKEIMLFKKEHELKENEIIITIVIVLFIFTVFYFLPLVLLSLNKV
jgi:hypothetical protein